MVLARAVSFKTASLTFFTKFQRCDWVEKLALGEALFLLILAAPAIKHCPLRYLGRVAALGPFRKRSQTDARAKLHIDLVKWAIDRASKRSPFRSKCFEQGLTAQIMLRRRGIDSTLLYGVNMAPNTPQGLRAHVWVETELEPIVGQPDVGEFALLATWPEGRHQIWIEEQP